jgi:hypothetical protein
VKLTEFVVAGVLAALAGAGWAMSRKTSPRAAIVEAARGELGKGESAKYWRDVNPDYIGSDASWCGGFALWCLHQAGVALALRWIVAKGFLFNLKQIPVSAAQPGDIAYFHKFQHHAVIVENNGDGTLRTINGNGTGGVVTESLRATPDAVYSIESVLS